ncbi:putative pi31 proteasome regulator [Erysiphe neolycopersici]|uniref:Putative pi31 proteasome regulator n=1 Tax=Erysiphe neolycopersici TaxID=212602 RepID=A0A420HY16_9PEZI|nr:putative pi31 proteasome regulator [Erysiphe neolycopersici]
MPASLTTASILRHLANALPTHTKDDTSSDLSSSYEVIAIFCHACMIASGFRLLGFREGQTLDECSRLAPRLPPEWNSTFNSYTFIYAHEESSMRFVIKVDRLGSKAEIRGIGLEDDRINRFEVTARDYITQSSLPLRIKICPDGEEDRSDLEEKLKNLASIFDLAIIKKLVPSLNKDHEKSQSSTPANVNDGYNQSQITQIPLRTPITEPRVPTIPHPYPIDTCPPSHPNHPFPQGDFPPPGFDDEYDLNRIPPRYPSCPNVPPFNIGYDDLNPQGLGPRDPLRGTFTGGGFGGGMNGMHPTFDGPLFGGTNGRGLNNRRPEVPEGARYDPVGPGDMPPGNGRPFNPFDKVKDWDII